MIDRMALSIAGAIKRANPEQTSSIELMKFSLIIWLNSISIVLLSLSIGAALGHFSSTLFVLCTLACLKHFSGGIHLKNADACTIFSTLVIVSVPLMPIQSWHMYTMLAFSTLMMLLFAPSNISSKATKASRWSYKLIATGITAFGFVLLSENFAKCCFLQVLTLINYKDVWYDYFKREVN